MQWKFNPYKQTSVWVAAESNAAWQEGSTVSITDGKWLHENYEWTSQKVLNHFGWIQVCIWRRADQCVVIRAPNYPILAWLDKGSCFKNMTELDRVPGHYGLSSLHPTFPSCQLVSWCSLVLQPHPNDWSTEAVVCADCWPWTLIHIFYIIVNPNWDENTLLRTSIVTNIRPNKYTYW